MRCFSTKQISLSILPWILSLTKTPCFRETALSRSLRSHSQMITCISKVWLRTNTAEGLTVFLSTRKRSETTRVWLITMNVSREEIPTRLRCILLKVLSTRSARKRQSSSSSLFIWRTLFLKKIAYFLTVRLHLFSDKKRAMNRQIVWEITVYFNEPVFLLACSSLYL